MSLFEAPDSGAEHKKQFHQRFPENIGDSVTFTSFNSSDLVPGENQVIDHPEIVQGLKDGSFVSPKTPLIVAYGPDYSEEDTLAEYLKNIGSNYDEFKQAYEQADHKDVKNILLELHKRAVVRRFNSATKLDKFYDKEGTPKGELRAEGVREHSLVFDKYINDLGIFGVESSTAMVGDYKDGIDQYLILDPVAMSTDGEDTGRKVHIGIQRSFDDKSEEVLESHTRYVPELISEGPISRVFWRDREVDYRAVHDRLMDMRREKLLTEAERQHLSLLEYTDAQAKQKKVSAKEFMQGVRLAPISKALPRGEQQQYELVQEILDNTLDQLENYLNSETNPNYIKKLDRDISAIKLALTKIAESREMVN